MGAVNGRGIFVPKLDEQISTLQERLTQLKLRQERVDSRNQMLQSLRERKAETRRRVLVGTLVMSKVQAGEMDATVLRGWLDQTLTRAADRALFGLAPTETGPAPPSRDV
jgi:hypothetical protein